MNTLAEQLYQALGGLALGFSIGFLYDFYRALWRPLQISRLWLGVADICWWIVIFIWSFLVILWLNWAQLRGYIFLCVILGVAAYLLIIAPCLSGFWHWAHRAFRRTAGWSVEGGNFLLACSIRPFTILVTLFFRLLVWPLFLIKKMLAFLALPFILLARKTRGLLSRLKHRNGNNDIEE